jgi:hypothetical protein
MKIQFSKESDYINGSQKQVVPKFIGILLPETTSFLQLSIKSEYKNIEEFEIILFSN